MQNSNAIATGVQTVEDLVKIIESRKLIAQPGAYDLKVTGVTAYNGNHIVNLSAMSNYHVEEARELASEGKFQESANKQFTINVLPNGYLPAKGEIIKCYIDNVKTKSGVEGLFVTSHSELKSIAAGKVVFNFGTTKSTTETISSSVAENAFA
jgi:hypothetical protein